MLKSDRLKAYDLEQTRFRGMPNVHAAGYLYVLPKKHGDPESFLPDTSRAIFHTSEKTTSSASGLIVMSEHTGTHIDALSHIALGRKLHDDVPVTPEIETPNGFTQHGVENVKPIVCRGVLLDVARHKGVEALPELYRITLQDVEECSRDQGVELRNGDAILVRTGYGRFWNDPQKYVKAASVSLQASKWIADKGVTVVGADNTDWEGATGEKDSEMGVTLPCHALFIVERGILIVEHMNLEHLSADRVYEFLFVCTPLKIKGATGSPVRPIAIVEETN